MNEKMIDCRKFFEEEQLFTIKILVLLFSFWENQKEKSLERNKYWESKVLITNTQDVSSSFEFFYNFSKNELKTLKKYLNKYLKNKFIISSKSICATSILFIKKKRANYVYALIIASLTHSSSKIDMFFINKWDFKSNN
jgi:hypothetical protein